MPAQMPPGGAPQGPPPSAGPGAPPPEQGSGGGGAISTLLVNVDKAIDHLNLVIGQSKATNPEEKQMIQQVDQIFGQLMSALGVQAGDDGGGDEPEAQGPGSQGQTVPPEAAGNKGAIPAP